MALNQDSMKEPKVEERFADNGEHSHYVLVDVETGELLWSESPEDKVQVRPH